jgi:neurotransmitter:Na+ symporter, NSS family
MGTFGLGFNTMPVIFGRMPLSEFFQCIWFLLLFIAGITSSISVLQPAISFCEDEFALKRKGSVGVVGAVCLVMSLVAVLGLGAGAVDEMDFWGGTFALVVFGTIEAVLFAWVFGIRRGWEELQRGAHIRIPRFYRFVLAYVTPVYLILMLIAWFATDGVGVILLKGIDPAQMVEFAGVTMSKVHFITGLWLLLLLLLVCVNVAIYLVWKFRNLDAKLSPPLAEATHA